MAQAQIHPSIFKRIISFIEAERNIKLTDSEQKTLSTAPKSSFSADVQMFIHLLETIDSLTSRVIQLEQLIKK